MTGLGQTVAPGGDHGRTSGDEALGDELASQAPSSGEKPADLTRDMSGPAGRGPLEDIVEVWGLGSFPASDPPANW